MLIVGLAHNVAQQVLTLIQRQQHQTVVAEVQKVEAPKTERRRFIAKLHQRAETRHARVIAGDKLAIDDGVLGWEPAIVWRSALNRFV